MSDLLLQEDAVNYFQDTVQIDSGFLPTVEWVLNGRISADTPVETNSTVITLDGGHISLSPVDADDDDPIVKMTLETAKKAVQKMW